MATLVTLNIIGAVGSSPVPTVLKYDYQNNPFAITAIIGKERVEWVFSRDLLLEGLQGKRTGEGDVQVQAINGKYVMRLQNGSAGVSIEYRAIDIEQFLAVIYAEVPLGEEDRYIDWEKVL